MKRLKFAVRCLLSAALIFLIARKVNWEGLVAVLNRLDPSTAILASGFWGVLIVALALRWSIFLRQHRLKVPFPKVVALTWAGQFFNSLLPGSTGGDVFKIYQLCRLAPDRRAAAAATVLVDRFSASVALLMLAAAAFLIEPGPVRGLLGGRYDVTTAAALIGLGVIGLLGLWVMFRKFARQGLQDRIWRVLTAVRGAVELSPQVVFAFVLAFAIHLLSFMSVYFFARALGINVTWTQVLLMMPVVLLLVMLPVTINGHGLRELLFIGYFNFMGVGVEKRINVGVEETVVALSLLLVANDLLWSLPGGIRYLTRPAPSVDESHAGTAACPTR